MKKLVYLMLIISLLACEKEKTLNSYSKEDFYEVQAVVYELEEIKRFLDKSTWNVSYIFKINKQSYTGVQKRFNIPMSIGQTIIVLVHKKNSKISFFKEIGVLIE